MDFLASRRALCTARLFGDLQYLGLYMGLLNGILLN